MLLVSFPELRLLLIRVFLDKSIQFLVKYLISYFGLRIRELKEEKIKEILKTIYQYRDNIKYLKTHHDYYKI